MRKILILFSALFVSNFYAQDILPLKERAKFVNKLQKERFNNLLPELMEKTGIDMWVLIAREYNEDPIIKTMLPPTWLNARRTTIIVFSLDSETKNFESVAIARYAFGDNIPSIWNKEKQPNQWEALKDYIVSKNPEKIGINTSSYESLADGLSKYHYDQLYNVLSPKFRKKIVSAEDLAIAWIETRTDLEMTAYSQLVEISSAIIREAFSTKVITPGVTTTDDVVWWMREKVIELGLDTWFHPTVDVQRNDESDLYAFDNNSKFDTILPGDLLHCDFGISYLTLNTDTQELGYVLKPEETSAPDFLVNALKDGNRVQDIFTNNFKQGATGNQILKKSLEQGKAEGLRPSIYTHPLGTYGHSAGTTLGMWDSQGGVPFSGDYPLQHNTSYAIELNTTVYIPEWKKDIRIMLEVPGFFGKNGFRYINGRQTELLLVGSKQDGLTD
ncbi:aminopeptidase P family protein [Flavobacteriaceae bacterium]|nr:aminopeptidase P family protein [Flavobacteriaceae bacterium]